MAEGKNMSTFLNKILKLYVSAKDK